MPRKKKLQTLKQKTFGRKIVKNCIRIINHSFSKTYIGRKFIELYLETCMENSVSIKYGDLEMVFASPNSLTNYRYDTFSSKEPDTLDWLEKIPKDAVFWDIGANIGLYSIYAALKSDAFVFAFEPSVFNLEVLARNIYLNGLQNRITTIPNPLNDNLGISLFNMSSTSWGGALHSFGQKFDQEGLNHNTVFGYQTLGMTMTDAIRLLGIPAPNFIKIDVDGIEHFILRGGADVLSNVESVLVEINDDFKDQAIESFSHLENAGLSLYRKFAINSGNQHNQWWARRRI
jgi:FkbM family methyltransferase